MSETSNSPLVSSTDRESLLRPSILLRGAAGLAFLVLAALVGFEQLRPVPEPTPFAPPASRAGVPDRENAASGPLPSASETENTAGSATDGVPRTGSAETEETPSAGGWPVVSLPVPDLSGFDEEIVRGIRGILWASGEVTITEPSTLTKEELGDVLEDARDAIRRYYADATRAVWLLRAAPEETKDATYEEAWDHLRATAGPSQRLKSFGKWQWQWDAEHSLPLEEAKAAVYDAFQRAHVEVCAMRGEWEFAATSCLYLPDRGGREDWNREIYYWRRCGLRGRGALALRTVQRAFGKVGEWTHGLNPILTGVHLEDSFPGRKGIRVPPQK